MYMVDWKTESEKATALVQQAEMNAALQRPEGGSADGDSERQDAYEEGQSQTLRMRDALETFLS